MGWVLAQSIAQLRNEINARWPNRDRGSDGTIGDAYHQADNTSDHNPWLNNTVRAFDIDVDGIDAAWLAEKFRQMGAAGDRRVRNNGYVIFNRRITNPDFGMWRVYNGSDPHTSHIHLSVSTDGYNDGGSWGVGGAPAASAPAPAPAPAPSGAPGLPGWSLPGGHYYGNKAGPNESHGGFYGAEQAAVQAIQRRFIAKGCVPGVSDWRNGWADGLWENATDEACRNWFNNVDPRPAQQFTDRIYSDDYEVLNR